MSGYFSRLLTNTALPFALMTASAAGLHAEVVTVPTVPGSLDGANGANGVGGDGGDGAPGGDASAIANSTTDSSNTANAFGGAGGAGGAAARRFFHQRLRRTGRNGDRYCHHNDAGRFGKRLGDRPRRGRRRRGRNLQQRYNRQGERAETAATANAVATVSGVSQATVSATALGGNGGGLIFSANDVAASACSETAEARVSRTAGRARPSPDIPPPAARLQSKRPQSAAREVQTRAAVSFLEPLAETERASPW